MHFSAIAIVASQAKRAAHRMNVTQKVDMGRKVFEKALSDLEFTLTITPEEIAKLTALPGRGATDLARAISALTAAKRFLEIAISHPKLDTDISYRNKTAKHVEKMLKNAATSFEEAVRAFGGASERVAQIAPK
jgi:hypothetical protein